METPVFQEFDPAHDCDCPGCARYRPVPPHPRPRPGTLFRAREALLVATAATAALATVTAPPALAAAHAFPLPPGAPADDTPTPQGEPGPLYGPDGPTPGPGEATVTTRAEIIARAQKWVTAQVPYSTTRYWSDGYRQDCSGFVSMAWNLPANEWTGSLAAYGTRITKAQLGPGDMLLFHNPANPAGGSHVVIFGGWTNSTRTRYLAYEQTPPHTRKQSTPYAYWSNSSRYVPYRHRGLAVGAATSFAKAGR